MTWSGGLPSHAYISRTILTVTTISTSLWIWYFSIYPRLSSWNDCGTTDFWSPRYATLYIWCTYTVSSVGSSSARSSWDTSSTSIRSWTCGGATRDTTLNIRRSITISCVAFTRTSTSLFTSSTTCRGSTFVICATFNIRGSRT